MFTSPPLQIITREAKTISNGIANCNEAFLKIESGLPRQFYIDLHRYLESGQVKICVARLKPNGKQV